MNHVWNYSTWSSVHFHHSYTPRHKCPNSGNSGKIMCTVWARTIWVSVHTSENSSTKDRLVIQNTSGKPCVYKCVTNSASQCELLHFCLSQGDHDIGITKEWLQLKVETLKEFQRERWGDRQQNVVYLGTK